MSPNNEIWRIPRVLITLFTNYIVINSQSPYESITVHAHIPAHPAHPAHPAESHKNPVTAFVFIFEEFFTSSVENIFKRYYEKRSQMAKILDRRSSIFSNYQS